MDTMRQNPNRWTRRAATFLTGLGVTILALSPTIVRAETFESPHLIGCRLEGSDDLNRWPLRRQDISDCVEKGTKSPPHVRRQVQESALNLWPYASQPQRVEPLEAHPNGEDQDQSRRYVRTEPDLRMWPLWPQS